MSTPSPLNESMSGRVAIAIKRATIGPRPPGHCRGTISIGRAESKSGNGLFRRDRKVGGLEHVETGQLGVARRVVRYAEWLTNISAVDHDFAEHRHRGRGVY